MPRLVIRRARSEDLVAILALISGGAVASSAAPVGHPQSSPATAGSSSEGTGEGAGGGATVGSILAETFSRIDQDPAHRLCVGCLGDEIIATVHLSVLPSLAYGASTRGQIESMHVRADHRGHGYGRMLLDHAIEWLAQNGCVLIQLSSHRERDDAHRFYERRGFAKSHFGFKLWLTADR